MENTGKASRHDVESIVVKLLIIYKIINNHLNIEKVKKGRKVTRLWRRTQTRYDDGWPTNTRGIRTTDAELATSPATAAAGHASIITTTARTRTIFSAATATISIIVTIVTNVTIVVATATTNDIAVEATNNAGVRCAVTTVKVVV